MRPSLLVALALLAGLASFACSGAARRSPPAFEPAPAELDQYDVLWNSPSLDAAGSMPIGNGEVGANVWVEPGGDLLFLVARTDSFSEAARLLKLGRVRVQLEPNPFAAGAPFEQRLRLREGRIEIRAGAAGERVELELFVDAQADVIHVSGRSERALRVSATLESWRNQRKRLEGKELESSWTMRNAPASIEVSEAADLDVDQAGAVVWYHRNETSIVPLTLEHQGLSAAASLLRDPLLGRTFGGWMAGEGFAKSGSRSLETRAAVRNFEFKLSAVAQQCADVVAWIETAHEEQARSDRAGARAASADWWQRFWARSWVFVEGDPWPQPEPNEPAPSHAADPRPPSRITQAYLLQRWMQACGGRGNYPIKFNGSIFTVEPRFAGGPDFDADWRRWGDAYWWQNTRLPYHAMLASGDYDMLAPLFGMYREALAICEARAKLYYAAEGAYFPETMTIFGTYANDDYGWDRTGHARGEVLCPWWQWAWNQGPELVALGLDLYERTRQEDFLREQLLPIARATLAWFDTRFERDAQGVLVIEPTQALETHWHGVVNDLPCVVGLHEICGRLAKLPARMLSAADLDLLARVRRSLPAIPITMTEAGARKLSPAERYDPSRQNCESPELYALFPFRAARRGSELFEAARLAYLQRHDRLTNGWPQDGQDAALLGLVEDARANLIAKTRNSSPRFRFPAMWGPNFDWLPDQCHGSNLMHTLQLMLLQEDDAGRHLLPCFPSDWSVRFQLHARDGSLVRGEQQAR